MCNIECLFSYYDLTTTTIVISGVIKVSMFLLIIIGKCIFGLFHPFLSQYSSPSLFLIFQVFLDAISLVIVWVCKDFFYFQQSYQQIVFNNTLTTYLHYSSADLMLVKHFRTKIGYFFPIYPVCMRCWTSLPFVDMYELMHLD